MKRFYHYLPRILRIKDYLASGFDPEALRRDVPIAGVDGTFLGDLVGYRWRLAGHSLQPYGLYYLWTQVGADEPRREVFFNNPTARDEIDFDFATEAAPPHTFKMSVYDDRRMRAEDLIFTADSAIDPTGWSVRGEAIMEKVLTLLDEEAEAAELSIADLPDLVDADRTSPTGLILLSVYLGQLLDGTKPEAFRRWLVKNLVALYKIKGTTHSWKKRQHLTLGTAIPHIELWKTTLREKCDYSHERDGEHPFKSARFAFPGPCASGCETGAEIPELPRRAVLDVLDVLEEVRPIHVILRVPCKHVDLEDTFPALGEDLETIRDLIQPSDTFPLMEDTLDIIRSCVSVAQTGCLSCCETDCTACEAFACESDACQIACTTSCTGTGEAGCSTGCEAACMFGVQGGGGGGGILCDLSIQFPCLTARQGSDGCGGLFPGGGLKCQVLVAVPNPPPIPGCTTACEPSPQTFVAQRCTVSSTAMNPQPRGGSMKILTRIDIHDPEMTGDGDVTGNAPTPVFEWTTLTGIVNDASTYGYTLIRAEDGAVALALSFGSSGDSQGLVVSQTGEACNRCPSAVAGTIPQASQSYPSQQSG